MKNNGARSKSSLNWNLFLWCVLVFALTAVLLVIAWWLWGIVGDLKEQPVGRATSALTTVGGLGGAVFLTVKYRAHSLAEHQEDRDIESNSRAKEIHEAQLLTQKRQALVDATSLLGSDVAATRIAGITVLAEIADTYKDDYRQQVVDILCGYLRTTHKDDERGHDKAVESTILNTLASHLRKQGADKNGSSVKQTFDDDQLWCDCTFDLHDAIFTEPLDFSHTRFNQALNFKGVCFLDSVNFDHAAFSHSVSFYSANFTRNASFDSATFTEHVSFYKATFTEHVSFAFASLELACFDDATFTRNASFNSANFTMFTLFRQATFKGDASFYCATLMNSDFNDTTFTRNASFENATFAWDASFRNVNFEIEPDFKASKFDPDHPIEISFPKDLLLNEEGLPKGASWMTVEERDMYETNPEATDPDMEPIPSPE